MQVIDASVEIHVLAVYLLGQVWDAYTTYESLELSYVIVSLVPVIVELGVGHVAAHVAVTSSNPKGGGLAAVQD